MAPFPMVIIHEAIFHACNFCIRMTWDNKAGGHFNLPIIDLTLPFKSNANIKDNNVFMKEESE